MDEPSQFSMQSFDFERLFKKKVTKEELLEKIASNPEEVRAFKQASPPTVELRLSRINEGEKEYRLIAVRHLFDLSALGLVDLVSFGRSETNDLMSHTGTGEGIDLTVSRRHGLVVLNRKQVYYIDIGTFDDGSKNGMRVNDELGKKIKNRVFPWNKFDYLGAGERIIVPEIGRDISRFKLEYSYL